MPDLRSTTILSSLGTLLLGVVLLLGASRGVEADEIHFVDERDPLENATILEETYEEIRYRLPRINRPQTLPAGEVARIVHTDAPLAYERAKEALDRGEFLRAASGFEEVASNHREGWQRQYALFYQGEAYRRAGRLDRAREAYGRLEQEFPDSRFLPEARLAEGEMLLAADDPDGARTAFETLAREARDRDYGQEWVYRARLGQADVQGAEGRHREALRSYRDIVRDARRDVPAVSREARVRSFEVMVESGDHRGAVEEIESFVADEGLSARVAGPAFTYLGDAYRELGRHRDALEAYLKVVLLYDSAVSVVPKALYYAAEEYLATDLPGREAHANRLRQQLESRFPNSEWAQR